MCIFPSLQGVSNPPSLRRETGIQCLDQTRLPLSGPNALPLDFVGIIELGSGFALLSNHHNTHASSLQRSAGEEADPAVSAWSEIDSVCRSGRKVAGGHPVDGLREDLVAEGGREGSGQFAQVSACLD